MKTILGLKITAMVPLGFMVLVLLALGRREHFYPRLVYSPSIEIGETK